jgi:hypothetical protein
MDPAPVPGVSTAPLRVAVVITALLGAASLLGAVLGFAWSAPKIPPAIMYINLTAAVLDLGIAWGLHRRARVAWAYGLAIWGALLIMNALAVAALLRAGVPGQISLLLAVVRVFLGPLLIVSRRLF